MLTSVRWINDYLDRAATAEEQAELLTRAGFPLEGRIDVDGDVQQDFEMTSNRGDCVSHVGLAREIAAISGRAVAPPRARPVASGGPAAEHVTVANEQPALCPLYTARIITGLRVGPSPGWLADRLRAIGQIPRNAIVDATNFVLFELGQPTHVFDLRTLRGPAIVVRLARAGEPFLPIGEGEREIELDADDLVIADAERPVALAGVKGGALTAVTESTTDVLVEAAAFDPVAVRTASRRHGIASDSSYRFERGVHPAQVDAAADRLVELLLELAGGTLHEGVVSAGAPIPPPREVAMRCDRCRRLLGVEIPDETMRDLLDRLGFAARLEEGVARCTVPPHRLDVEREIDLVEEVARMHGLDRIPVAERIEITVAAPQPREAARRAVADALVGMGYVEAVTHSLVSEAAAAPFVRPGTSLLRVDDERAKATPILRPSLLPSLLRVRRHNLDNGVASLKLFESASTFWLEDGAHRERVVLGLLADAPDLADGTRPLRGAIERVVGVLAGPAARLESVPDDARPWLAPGAVVRVAGDEIGWLGVVARDAAEHLGLAEPPLVAAEIDLGALAEGYPPDAEARPLPSFPAVERDLSAIVPEQTTWADLERAVADVGPEDLEATEFVTTFRGEPIPDGRKSVTLRLRFRAPDRTLRHEDVDERVDRVVATLRDHLDAEIRQ